MFSCVHDWCVQLEAEQDDLCWEISLVHSITLTQARRASSVCEPCASVCKQCVSSARGEQCKEYEWGRWNE